jgi:hypothetical protein
MLVQTNGKIIMGVTYCESWFSCHPHTLVLGYDANLLLETGEVPVVNTNFLIYPNPVKESISLDFNLKQSEKLSVQLLDSNGREIVSLLKDVIFKAGANTTSLILPRTLQNGMYFLNITNETKRSIFKIIK